jgi:hypothetical protein
VWSRVLNEYLMGERPGVNDLMAWNADGTRMPYAMHSEYLRRLFLHNDLAEGRFLADGRAIALSSIRQPLFVVGTETDHVAPWHSVHKIHMLTSAAITFVLTSGGHNAGIVSEPGHKHRHYHMLERREGQAALSPDDWLTQANPYEGSWWEAWGRWLDAHSGSPCRLRRWAPRTRAIPRSPPRRAYVLEKMTSTPANTPAPDMPAPNMIENRTFEEIAVGESAQISRTLGQREIQLFALASGDVNPAHVDPEFAATDMFHKVIAHGLWGGGLISAVLGTELPGPGTIYLEQSLRFGDRSGWVTRSPRRSSLPERTSITTS